MWVESAFYRSLIDTMTCYRSFLPERLGRFARLTLVLLVLSVFASCHAPEEGSKQSGDWHFSGLEEVRAYRLNWEDPYSFNKILDEKGELNRTRLPEEGVLLNEAQLKRLKAAVTGTHPHHLRAACFYPHHAFVFFDSEGTVVGHINICFQCSNYDGTPAGFADKWDVESIRCLVEDLGMPIRNEKWD